jgi:ABA sandwich protein
MPGKRRRPEGRKETWRGKSWGGKKSLDVSGLPATFLVEEGLGMRKDEILVLAAGEEADLIVYDQIMGRPPEGVPERDRGDEHVRRYSTDIRHAERVLLRIVTEGGWAYVPGKPGSESVIIVFRDDRGRQVQAAAPTKALAICRAALLTREDSA